jgi:dCTP diphosphatase
MVKTDKDTTLQELKDLIDDFAKERGWDKHHTPKNLAISITLEAAELLEHFQWDDYQKNDKQALADELADVLCYAFNFALVCDIDVTTAYKNKLAKAAKKYPTEIFNPENDSHDDFFRIKKEYRQNK